MRVMDFIQQKYDSMNETDFLREIDALADQYAQALRNMPEQEDLHNVPGQVLLASFLLQEITVSGRGEHLLRNPERSVLLRELQKGYRAKNG